MKEDLTDFMHQRIKAMELLIEQQKKELEEKERQLQEVKEKHTAMAKLALDMLYFLQEDIL